jgi:hypothetical protein
MVRVAVIPLRKALDMTADGRPPPQSKDTLLKQAEEDVSRLRDVLRTTKAELARSKDIADRIENRRKKEPPH